ncbi:major facilitator superfamily MFS_1 [Gloeocapsa sp. PCC 7428]|uniref:MDR family MFS transporter n=1 Tax=Gloeocapsa sp. PCC 7428 TaxID=1173026 RepID=UPI0002A5D0ED|nr:MFS transporter [Gloeocapsa sp. PCC 7428]AFZ29359.1 major facilitator superfamily MFS_1 [Gloeocapsa sp. PCC 7428]
MIAPFINCMKFFQRQLSSWLPQLDPQVWILGFGRFLSEVGTGFTLFYAPIFFVNQVGFSATAVGFALGSASISGIFGRILGGSLSDSPKWGRRYTLLLSAAVAAIASLVLASTITFPILIVGNLLSGLGQGLYWPATEAVVADLTTPANRREAYALTRLADNLGLGTGIIFGGALVSTTGAYRALFLIDATSFIVFFVVIYLAIKETYQPLANASDLSAKSNWAIALRDRRLLVYVLVNIIFTTYTSQLHSTLPLYLRNFVSSRSTQGFTESTLSALFACHMAVAILCQLPIARVLKRFTHPHALIVSALIWAVAFSCVWFTGITPVNQLFWAIVAMSIFGLAIVSYTPSAAALVTELAPESQRGVYFSMSSLCWAVGYFIGPPLGGWALDQSRVFVYSYWLGLAASVFLTIAILHYLNQLVYKRSKEKQKLF